MKTCSVLMNLLLYGTQRVIQAAQMILNELRIPVIFMTDRPDMHTFDFAKQARPCGYLVRPFNDVRLKRRLELVLLRHDSECSTVIAEK